MMFNLRLRRRDFLAHGAAAAAATGVVFPGGASAAEAWRSYTYFPVATNAGAQCLARIGTDLEQASGGAVKVSMHLGGSLPISATDITRAIADNLVQLGDDTFYMGNVPSGGVLRLPIIFSSIEEYLTAQKAVAPVLDAEFARRGVLVLARYMLPPQVIWSSKPLKSLGDIRNRKIRVQSAEQGDFVKRFDGVAIMMGTAEVSPALDRGVIDGLISSSSSSTYVWRDQLKFNYQFVVNYQDSLILVNKEAFGRMEPKLQAALRASAEKHAQWSGQTYLSEQVEYTKKMAESGTQVTPASQEDKAEAAKRFSNYTEEWSRTRGADAAAALKVVRAAIGK